MPLRIIQALIVGLTGQRASSSKATGNVAINEKTEPALPIDELAKQIKTDPPLNKLKELFDLAEKQNKRIILFLQFPGVDLINVVSGKVLKTAVEPVGTKEKLILRFQKFTQEDLEIARKAMNRETNNSPRYANPMHCLYTHNEPIVELCTEDERFQQVKKVFLGDEFEGS